MTDSLVARLREAIDETERIAQAAGGSWTLEGERDELLLNFGTHTTSDIGFYEDDTLRPNQARHIVRHDPAAVLRRCAADRKILAEHEAADPDYQTQPWTVCTTCVPDREWPCTTLLALAEAYGIHEDEE